GLLLAGCATTTSFAQGAAATGPLAESVPSDLPRVARPLHYAIEVVPDATTLTFEGTTSIDIEVFERTDTLTLHANELQFTVARLVPANGAGAGVVLDAQIDPDAQTVRLKAPTALAPGKYRLEFAYTGKINTQATGLFALDYPDKRTGQQVR